MYIYTIYIYILLYIHGIVYVLLHFEQFLLELIYKTILMIIIFCFWFRLSLWHLNIFIYFYFFFSLFMYKSNGKPSTTFLSFAYYLQHWLGFYLVFSWCNFFADATKYYAYVMWYKRRTQLAMRLAKRIIKETK